MNIFTMRNVDRASILETIYGGFSGEHIPSEPLKTYYASESVLDQQVVSDNMLLCFWKATIHE